MRKAVLIGAAALLAACGTPEPEAPTALSADVYASAERFLLWNKDKYLTNANPMHHWIAGEGPQRFWFAEDTADGKRFRVVDAATGEREDAFDHAAMAEALNAALEPEELIDAGDLPILSLVFVPGAPTLMVVTEDGKTLSCSLPDGGCEPTPMPDLADGELPLATGQVLFVRNHNLWVRQMDGSDERALTTTGSFDKPWARFPESSTSEISMRRAGAVLPPIVLPLPDGVRFLTYRQDHADVEQLHLVQSVPEDGSFRPVLHSYRYDLAGGPVPQAELAIINPVTGEIVEPDLPPLPSTLAPPILNGSTWFNDDGSKMYVVWPSDSYTALTFTEVDTATGETRQLHHEDSDTVYLSAAFIMSTPNMRVLSNGDFIWYSERSGWGHLYLYDGEGNLKNAITSGDWLVQQIAKVDEANGVLYVVGSGREAGRDPYFRHLYRVALDGSGIELLTPEDADHEIRVQMPPYASILSPATAVGPNEYSISPTGEYIVDVMSWPDKPSQTVVRDGDGTILYTLIETGYEKLAEGGLTLPEPFEALAADGETPIYGVIFKPSNFDPSKSYPVIDSIYPGPQVYRVPKRFDAAVFDMFGGQSAAETGFVVVAIDGRGKPGRSKAFRDRSYGNLRSAGSLDDHIAAMQQLAAERPYMDLDRVGIFGSSGGGFATARAMFDYPDFYKVGASSAGNHDQRVYISLWGEMYQGPVETADYENLANTTGAENLKGKLLLSHGELDDNVHPANTMRVVDALIKANKDFDMFIMPNVAHGIGGEPYYIRMRWDYFVRHLAGLEPPAGYEITKPED